MFVVSDIEMPRISIDDSCSFFIPHHDDCSCYFCRADPNGHYNVKRYAQSDKMHNSIPIDPHQPDSMIYSSTPNNDHTYVSATLRFWNPSIGVTEMTDFTLGLDISPIYKDLNRQERSATNDSSIVEIERNEYPDDSSVVEIEPHIAEKRERSENLFENCFDIDYLDTSPIHVPDVLILHEVGRDVNGDYLMEFNEKQCSKSSQWLGKRRRLVDSQDLF